MQGSRPEIYETIDELPKIVDKVREALSSSQDRTEQELGNADFQINPEKAEPAPIETASGLTLGKRGKAETSIILQQIESKLVPQGFFTVAKNTAEVRTQLQQLLGLEFQSRKVSQALGELYQKSLLKRTGSKGNFRYIIV
jgi:hypothetical protein